MSEDWVKAHSRLFTGFWAGVPRAHRFHLLELALAAKALGGSFELPFGTRDPIEGVVALFGGGDRRSRKEVRDAIMFLSSEASIGTGSGTPTVVFERERDRYVVTIPQFHAWNAITSSAERMRRKREADRRASESRDVESGSDVTCDITCDAREERRGEEKRGDPPYPPGGESELFDLQPPKAEPKRAKPKATASKRATRIPDDWEPTEDLYAYAARAELVRFDRRQVDRCAEEFRNYWLACPGAKGTKLDWPATFRNWLIAERKRHPNLPEPAAEPPPPPSPEELEAAREARRVARAKAPTAPVPKPTDPRALLAHLEEAERFNAREAELRAAAAAEVPDT